MTNPAPAPAGLKNDFGDLVNLLDQLTDAENDLSKLNTQLNVEHLANVRLHTDTYKRLQSLIGETEAAIQVIAARNPQWFEEKKTVETPYGVVKRTSSTSLVIADEAVTITLIEAAGRAGDFVVTTKTISREALEKLDDDELKKYGVRRETKHNYKPEAAALDLGKAVKQAEKSDKAAKKTAKSAAS